MRTNPALRVPCATCNAAIGVPCKWGSAPHDARIWIARSILGAPVIAAAPTPSGAKRRSKRAAPKPTQLDLPIDWTEAMAASIARFEVPPEWPVQSPDAHAVADEVDMRATALRVLSAKAEKATKAKVARPKPRVLAP